eukprot:gene5224-8836_t
MDKKWRFTKEEKASKMYFTILEGEEMPKNLDPEEFSYSNLFVQIPKVSPFETMDHPRFYVKKSDKVCLVPQIAIDETKLLELFRSKKVWKFPIFKKVLEVLPQSKENESLSNKFRKRHINSSFDEDKLKKEIMFDKIEKCEENKSQMKNIELKIQKLETKVEQRPLTVPMTARKSTGIRKISSTINVTPVVSVPTNIEYILDDTEEDESELEDFKFWTNSGESKTFSTKQEKIQNLKFHSIQGIVGLNHMIVLNTYYSSDTLHFIFSYFVDHKRITGFTFDPSKLFELFLFIDLNEKILQNELNTTLDNFLLDKIKKMDEEPIQNLLTRILSQKMKYGKKLVNQAIKSNSPNRKREEAPMQSTKRKKNVK